MEKIKLQHVHFLPKELESGILYVSLEYGIAGHLCLCGCGNKVITPLGPAEWSFSETNNKPTLHPSIGNWQLPCQSHYCIIKGNIEWSYQFTEEQIAAGRKAEEEERKFYYEKIQNTKTKRSLVKRIFAWFFR